MESKCVGVGVNFTLSDCEEGSVLFVEGGGGRFESLALARCAPESVGTSPAHRGSGRLGRGSPGEGELAAHGESPMIWPE